MYATNIRRLAGFVGRVVDQIVKLTFADGFPRNISAALQQLPGINQMDISELIPTAMVLTANKTQDHERAVIASQSQSRYRERSEGFEGWTKIFRTFSG